MRLQREIPSTFTLLLSLSCTVTVFAKDNPLCLTYGDGESFCSASPVDNGKSLSNLLASVLQVTVDRAGRQEVTANEPFNDLIPEAAGPLQFNRKLDHGSKKTLSFLKGPESFTRQGDFIYAAASDGIYKVNVKTNEHQKLFDGKEGCNAPDRDSCSRPLGIRVKDKTLLCVDGLKGLVSVDTESGDFKVLLPIGVDVGGEKIMFPDDLDVDWDRGLVYFSDGSTKWDLHSWMMPVLENDPSGRVIQFNLQTGEASVFAKGIRFSNGIQIARDGKSLLVSEFSARRILQYPFDQPLPVTGTPFTKVLLPGQPDNIRPSLSGGYWVALAMGRINGSRTLVDELQARPAAAKRLGNWMLSAGEMAEIVGQLANRKDLSDLGTQVKTGIILASAYPHVGTVVELDAEGNVLQALQSHEHAFITQTNELEDGLYLGSFINEYILFVPRASYQRS